MKNIKLKLSGLVGVLALAVIPAQAQTSLLFSTNLAAPGAGTNYATNGQVILTNGGYYVSEIDVSAGAGASNAIVTLYDTATVPTNGTSNGVPSYVITNAYTNIVKTEQTTNVTSVLTNNSTGQIYTNVYPGTFTIFTTNAFATGSTNPSPAISLFSTPPSTVQRRVGQHIALVYGLSATVNTSNVNVTVFYSPTF